MTLKWVPGRSSWTATCELCGVTYFRPERGPWGRYCGGPCRNRAKNLARRLALSKKAGKVTTCPTCGEKITQRITPGPLRKYCGPECKGKAAAARGARRA